ncbi:hypothetical protein GJ496_003585 [Pomphorhynchus laevis]|nr:hypothetical protein GJ496_003585 [Pomphorhynchus laevis]
MTQQSNRLSHVIWPYPDCWIPQAGNRSADGQCGRTLWNRRRKYVEGYLSHSILTILTMLPQTRHIG